ncbi:hypothetical protein [Actinoplanes italicus]|uniref:Uncharacterized protein n=1 Tax=Actinoplanes italicus TaxID=113567 RepID=A0A2T0JLE5_9ACTN|nr:hypothetical protein [Actinoplanes italicus]PRX08424.1 hypothetical protein CLV67_14023 [Actinoplanes italicus]
MTDRISSNDQRHLRNNRGHLRPTLWILLILNVAANAVASSIGATTLTTALSILFGLVALMCAATLVVDHYRHHD